jgi:hypothetical protein
MLKKHTLFRNHKLLTKNSTLLKMHTLLKTHTVNFFNLLKVFFCVCALFSLLSAAPAAQPQLVLSSLGAAAAIAAAAGLKGAVIAGQCSTNH